MTINRANYSYNWLKTLLILTTSNYFGIATAAELKYAGNAESSVDLIEGNTRKQLDSDRLFLAYTEAIAPIIVADAEAKARKFVKTKSNSPTDASVLSIMTATGRYAAKIDYGLLQGVAQAQVKADIPQAPKSPVLSAKTSVVQNLSWKDKLTVSSTSLPKGKKVKLKFTLKFTGQLHRDPTTQAQCRAFFGIYISDSRKPEITIICKPAIKIETVTKSEIIELKVGETVDLIGKLELNAKIAEINPQQPSPNASAAANVQNTARFYIDPVDANISYITESGRQYINRVGEQN